jgi:phospholipid N-methyltransferase
MKETAAFLKAFINDPLAVGSVVPSSTAAGEAMAFNIAPHQGSIVLEVGCGTGAFTEAIAKKLPDQKSYLGIEINHDLTEILRARFPALKFVNGDAREATKIHQQSDLGKVKYIISGLPFASLPKDVSEKVLSEIHCFMQQGDCLFRAIQYSTAFYMPSAVDFRRRMEALYGKTDISPLVWLNVPPAFALTWRT